MSAQRRSELLVDSAAMFHGVQRDGLRGVVNPEQQAPVADAVFLHSPQIGRGMPDGIPQGLWVGAQPLEFLRDMASGGAVQSLERLLKRWGGLKPVRQTRLLAWGKKRADFSGKMFTSSLSQFLDQLRLMRNQVVFQLLVEVFKGHRNPQHFFDHVFRKTDRLHHTFPPERTLRSVSTELQPTGAWRRKRSMARIVRLIFARSRTLDRKSSSTVNFMTSSAYHTAQRTVKARGGMPWHKSLSLPRFRKIVSDTDFLSLPDVLKQLAALLGFPIAEPLPLKVRR